MPASAVPCGVDGAYVTDKGELVDNGVAGLTKREEAAIAALQGMLANPLLAQDDMTVNEAIEGFSASAVWAADALFDQLEKTGQ